MNAPTTMRIAIEQEIISAVRKSDCGMFAINAMLGKGYNKRAMLIMSKSMTPITR
jgi:hypothetical protein